MTGTTTRSRPAGRGLLAMLFLVAGLLGLLFAPVVALARQDDAAEIQADATLRFVHASPGAPDVDVLIDGQPLVEGATFGSATTYAPIAPGEHIVHVVPAGGSTDDAVAQLDLNADQAASYILVAFGPLAEIQAQVYQVNLDDVTPGNARVRVINTADEATGDVDLTITGGDSLFDNVGSGDASDYADLAAGSYSFDIRGDEDRILSTSDTIEIADANAYDLVVVGEPEGSAPALLPLVTRVSPPCSEVLGMGTAEDACIRLIHASPDAPNVDVYLNDSLVTGDIAYGAATGFVTVPGGEGRTIQVAAAGTQIEEAVLTADETLDAGQAYNMLVTGTSDDLQLFVTGVDLRPVPENQARLGMINVSPDAGPVTVDVADGPQLFEDLGYRAQTEYIAIDTGDYSLQVHEQNDQNLITLTSDLSVQSGTVYDLVILGRAADDQLTFLVLEAPVELQVGEAATPVGTATMSEENSVPAATAETATDNTPLADVITTVEPTASPAP